MLTVQIMKLTVFYTMASSVCHMTYIFILYSQTVFIAMTLIVKQSTVIRFPKENGML